MDFGQIRNFSVVLALSVLGQSCVIYSKSPTTLEEASKERLRSKITLTNGTELKFKYLVQEEQTYYGIAKKSGQRTSTPLQREYVRKVEIQNQTASALATLGVIVVPVAAFVILGRYVLNKEGFNAY